MPELTHLRLERPSDGVAVLTLDNPDQRNAMSDEMTASWVAAIDELAARPVGAGGRRDRRGLGVLLGRQHRRGSRASRTPTVDHLRTRMIAFYRAWLSIRRLEVPTIAAVNGPAIGAGLCLALACDIRYAAAGAKLGVPFVKLGMHAGHGRRPTCCPNVVGEAHARDLLLTGRIVDADEALRLGLVSRVIEPDAFRDEVLATAAGIAATAPIASRLTKLALRDGGHARLRERACSGRRWPSRSRWPPRTCRRGSGPPARSGRRSSPAVTLSRRAVEEAPGPSSRRLPSPCECRSDGPGASSARKR